MGRSSQNVTDLFLYSSNGVGHGVLRSFWSEFLVHFYNNDVFTLLD
jgi:hypothetical protein